MFGIISPEQQRISTFFETKGRTTEIVFDRDHSLVNGCTHKVAIIKSKVGKFNLATCTYQINFASIKLTGVEVVFNYAKIECNTSNIVFHTC